MGSVATLDIRINSFGGSVVDGIAIHNAIRRSDAEVTVYVDGIAASIASLIAMAGDTVKMAENARMMLHAPWGFIVGNAKEAREFADQLDGWSDALVSSYARQTGPEKSDEIRDMLKDGTDHWFNADEALDYGLIDEIDDPIELAAKARFDLSNRYPNFSAKANSRSQRMPRAAKPNQDPNPMPAAPAANPAAGTSVPATDPTPVPANPVAATPQPQPAGPTHQEFLASEKARKDAIVASFAPLMGQFDLGSLERECIMDSTVTVEMAREKLLAKLGEGTEPANPTRVTTVQDEGKLRIGGIRAALDFRAGFAPKEDTANPYRGYSLMELCRESMAANNIKVPGADKMQTVRAAFTHSTSDFPLLLENIANKSMLKGWEEVEETFPEWTVKGTLPDFKLQKRVDLNLFPNLLTVPEGGEYSYATLTERGESILLLTIGRMFSMTRQMVINDDMDAMSKVPNRMGRAAKRSVGDMVYAQLTGNVAMSDGLPLFDAAHNNILTGAAISTDSIDAAQVAMALQKDPDNIAKTGLGIRLARLLVPVAIGGQARVVRDSQFKVATTIDNTIPNHVQGAFEITTEARLDADSSTQWYGVASGAMHDTLEVAYLDGNDQPFMDSQNGWNVDGAEMKVRLDVGVKTLDYRAFVRNVGA